MNRGEGRWRDEKRFWKFFDCFKRRLIVNGGVGENIIEIEV